MDELDVESEPVSTNISCHNGSLNRSKDVIPNVSHNLSNVSGNKNSCNLLLDSPVKNWDKSKLYAQWNKIIKDEAATDFLGFLAQ